LIFFALQAASIAAANYMHGIDFSLYINVRPQLLAKELACTLIVGIRHKKKYTVMACWAKVKFNVQKGHEWMTVTFSKVVLYGQLIIHK